MNILARRSFLRGLFAAPAVVAASSLMPVSAKLLTPNTPGLLAKITYRVLVAPDGTLQVVLTDQTFKVPDGYREAFNGLPWFMGNDIHHG